MKPVRETTIVVARTCLRPKCQRTAICRGLCDVDYQIAHRLVVDGLTTWKELEGKGKANEPKRTAKTWFLS